MQRNEERRQEPRRRTDHTAPHQLGSQDHLEDDDAEPEGQERTPSFLTAQELQAWDPATSADRRERLLDRRSNLEARRIQMPDE